MKSAQQQIEEFAAGLSIPEEKLPRMICGCKLKQGKKISLDVEGFVICPDHGLRRLGWRSVPYRATTMPMMGVGAWSELEYERYVLFGIPPLVHSA